MFYAKVIILFLSCFVYTTKAQIIGYTSSLSVDCSNNSNQILFSNNHSLHILWQKSKFTLGVGIGKQTYQEKYPLLYHQGTLSAYVRYLELIPYIRFSPSLNDVPIHFGISPTFNFKQKASYRITNSNNILEEDYFSSVPFMIGYMAEVGAHKSFNGNRIQIGISASFKENLSKIITETKKGFIGRSIALNISLEYKL